MSSLKKIEANRRNAQLSTGPRTPEGKTTVAANALTHGLRAEKAFLYFEDDARQQQTLAGLTAEWQPATPTEANLVEQMAIAQLKLIRLESMLSHAFLYSYVLQSAAEEEVTRPADAPQPFDLIDDCEFKIHKMITGLSQNIARVERAWHKALDTLQKLQNQRAKHASPTVVQSPVQKNADQSHHMGDEVPRKEVGSCINEVSTPAATRRQTALPDPDARSSPRFPRK